uniref:Methyl-accepting chemotaxis protein n=1 Tax=Gordonia phage Petito TaxID=3158876 RepID=A0AAU8GSC3_9CAUD
MRKATLLFSALSFVTSAVTLGVLAYGAKRVHNDIQDVRAKTNESLHKMKVAMLDIQI